MHGSREGKSAIVLVMVRAEEVFLGECEVYVEEGCVDSIN